MRVEHLVENKNYMTRGDEGENKSKDVRWNRQWGTAGRQTSVIVGEIKCDFHAGVTLSGALFLWVNGDYHKAGPLKWTPGHTKKTTRNTKRQHTHTHGEPGVRSRWNMDPNGCVPSLKGLGVDLSVVKRLVQLHEAVNSGSQVWILIPVGNT